MGISEGEYSTLSYHTLSIFVVSAELIHYVPEARRRGTSQETLRCL